MSDSEENYEKDKGIVFSPTDKELIENYLIPKINNQLSENFIVMKDVYAKEPWLLDHNVNDPFFMENEWYYFVTRTQVSEKKIGFGKKSKRKITGYNDDIDRGNWKADHCNNIIDEDTNKIIGTKQRLTFTKSNNKKKMKREDGSSATVPGSDSSWIMTEYMLPYTGSFQELVLCKIHEIKKSKQPIYYHESSSSSEQQQQQLLEVFMRSSWSYDHGASTSNSLEQQLINYQQPLFCNGKAPERNREQRGEGNIAHHIEALSLIEMVPERSSHKGKQVETMEVEEDWIGDYMNKYASKGFEGVLMINNKREKEDAPNMQWMDQDQLHISTLPKDFTFMDKTPNK